MSDPRTDGGGRVLRVAAIPGAAEGRGAARSLHRSGPKLVEGPRPGLRLDRDVHPAPRDGNFPLGD